MKALIKPYLESQGINEDFKILFLRYTTRIYKADNGFYKIEFPMWRFNCPKPSFSHNEIKEALLNDLKDAKIDYVNSKYAGDQSTIDLKISEINNLSTEEDLRNYG